MDRFHLSAYVRKRSGAFWEGAVVGHYTTAQTPDGIAVQLFGWIDGPVQIYPAAALELCDHSNSRLPPPLSSHVTSEYERQEAICTDAAMSQWERSLQRPDMQEKDRVRGAVEAYKRQALAFRMFPPAPVKHVAGDATLWVSPVDLRAWQREKAGEIFAWSENVEGQCVPLRFVEEPHSAPSSPVAWVADYTKSDGTTDYYVMIGEGERAMSLHMHSIRGRAEYEAAEINHALTGSPKPEFDDFALDAATPSPQPNVRVWTQKDAGREYVAFAEWFKERGYPGYPDLYPLTTENAMHSAWQEAAKRAALATTEGKDNG